MIQSVNIQELLPHRPPFIMVDRLTAYQEDFASTEMVISEDNIFCRNGFFSEAGMIENMAQTCAARLGYKSLVNNMPVKLGIIGAVKDFNVFFLPVPGNLLVTEIQIEHEVFNAILLSAEICCNGKKVVISHMKLFLTDIDSQPHEDKQ